MLIAWKKDLFEINFIDYGIYSLSVKLLDRSSGLTGLFSCIYDPSYNRGKEELWTKLFDLSNLTDGAWCVDGDFNEVLYWEDIKGRRSSNIQIKKFMNGVIEFALIDITIKNLQYTWTNFRENKLHVAKYKILLYDPVATKISGDVPKRLPRPI